MDADWDEVRLSPRCRAFGNDRCRKIRRSQQSQVGRVPFPPPGTTEFPRPPTTIAFDTCQELLWTGNDRVFPHKGGDGGRNHLLTPYRDASSPYTVPNSNDIPLSGYILPAMDLSGSSSSMTRESLPSVLGPSIWPLAGGRQYGTYGMLGWCLMVEAGVGTDGPCVVTKI